MQIYADTLYPDFSHPFLYNFLTGLTAVKIMFILQRKSYDYMNFERMRKFTARFLSLQLYKSVICQIVLKR